LLHKAVEWGWISHAPVKVRLLQDEARRMDYLTAEAARDFSTLPSPTVTRNSTPSF